MPRHLFRRPVAWAIVGVMVLGIVLGSAISQSRGAGREEIPEIALSGRAARTLGVAPGDVIEVAATPAGPWRRVRIARVYRPLVYPTEVADRDVDLRFHLPDLQALLGLSDAGDVVDSIVVRLRDPAGADRLASRLTGLGLGARAYTSADLARRTSGTFEVVSRFHRAISMVAVLAAGVFLLAIMTLRGEEMRRQVGAARLLGLSSRSVAGTVLLTAAGVAGAGTFAGIVLAYVFSAAMNVYYRRYFDTDLVFSTVTPTRLGDAATLSVALGIAAGGLVAWRLLRRPPLEQMGR